MAVPLSKPTLDRLRALFPEDEWAAAEKLLTESCADNLPLIHNPTPYGLERIRFAVLKNSEGKSHKLQEAAQLARIDWRDALVVAGFGHDVDVHKTWWPGESG